MFYTVDMKEELDIPYSELKTSNVDALLRAEQREMNESNRRVSTFCKEVSQVVSEFCEVPFYLEHDSANPAAEHASTDRTPRSHASWEVLENVSAKDPKNLPTLLSTCFLRRDPFHQEWEWREVALRETYLCIMSQRDKIESCIPIKDVQIQSFESKTISPITRVAARQRPIGFEIVKYNKRNELSSYWLLSGDDPAEVDRWITLLHDYQSTGILQVTLGVDESRKSTENEEEFPHEFQMSPEEFEGNEKERVTEEETLAFPQRGAYHNLDNTNGVLNVNKSTDRMLEPLPTHAERCNGFPEHTVEFEDPELLLGMKSGRINSIESRTRSFPDSLSLDTKCGEKPFPESSSNLTPSPTVTQDEQFSNEGGQQTNNGILPEGSHHHMRNVSATYGVEAYPKTESMAINSYPLRSAEFHDDNSDKQAELESYNDSVSSISESAGVRIADTNPKYATEAAFENQLSRRFIEESSRQKSRLPQRRRPLAFSHEDLPYRVKFPPAERMPIFEYSPDSSVTSVASATNDHFTEPTELAHAEKYSQFEYVHPLTYSRYKYIRKRRAE
ncbi:hypothetical protein IE077_002379 [Cardiosporidium cionae]|uniref:PH domain-containing protein n=1 Tax=Cardiosporidium cionae TaxID=476202 RepID=A0ABQ7JGM7_9APIC|nr:hypothetical protein IE077_002379 [Cardiosporidium cionae]|eukprot:KAF8822835.1 hypothetical protein IE077_002379 [Cardiosporidium cionae]